MQQQEYSQISDFGLGSLVGDFFQNVKDVVGDVAKKVAPIAPYVLPFVPGLGPIAKFGIGAGIGALAGQKPAEIAKNLALQTATAGIGGLLGSTGAQGTIGQRFMSGITGRELPQITSVPTEKGFFGKATEKLVGALDPRERAINPEFKKAQLLGKLSGIDLSEEDLIGLGIPKESSFMYQYGPLAYAGLTALPLAEQFLAPKPEEEEDTGGYESLYAMDPARYQLLDITGLGGYDPTVYAAEGGEMVTGFAQGSGQKITHPDGKTREHPKRIGEIVGPGTGTSDDIPAMLSDGEFVMTAKAVRNAGNGSRKEGAKNMYKMMKSLENGGSLSRQSIGMA